jgi:hypothetical protein
MILPPGLLVTYVNFAPNFPSHCPRKWSQDPLASSTGPCQPFHVTFLMLYSQPCMARGQGPPSAPGHAGFPSATQPRLFPLPETSYLVASPFHNTQLTLYPSSRSYLNRFSQRNLLEPLSLRVQFPPTHPHQVAHSHYVSLCILFYLVKNYST